MMVKYIDPVSGDVTIAFVSSEEQLAKLKEYIRTGKNNPFNK